jgi:hypothetical protein
VIAGLFARMGRLARRPAGRWAALRAGAVGLGLAFLCAQVSSTEGAQTRSDMLALGAEMLRMPASPAGDERILLNGLELVAARARTPRAVSEVLAEAEGSCAAGGAAAGEAQGDPGSVDRPAAVRAGDERRGFVSCAGSPSAPAPIAYTYAERRGESTHVITLRGDRAASAGALFPREGDAPGADPAALPRPASSRRALSARVAGQPYEAVVYLDRARGLDDLVAHYQAALPRAGWSVVAPWRVDEGPGPRQASVLVERAGARALLVLARDPAGTSTTFLSMEANREQ